MQHIIAPLHELNFNVWKDSAWIALELAKRFENSQMQYELWSPEPVTGMIVKYNIKTLRPYQGMVPAGGDLWVVGADVPIGNWYTANHYETVSVIYHEASIDAFFRHLSKLKSKCKVGVFYTSRSLAHETGVSGRLYEIDLVNNSICLQDTILDKRVNSRFTVGRISPNSTEWHHPDDIPLYQSLIDSNITVRLAGGDCLKPWLAENLPVEYSTETHQIEHFVAGLDCIVCRSTPSDNKSFIPLINAAIRYDIPIILSMYNPISEHLTQYKKCYLLNSNSEIIDTILALNDTKG